MSDYIVTATAANMQIRAFACTAQEMVEEARRTHNTSPVITAALGRLLCAAAMMGHMMKGEKDILNIQIDGDGPAGRLLAMSDSSSNVKGMVDMPAVILPAKANGKLNVSGAIGKGTLTVIKDLGMKEPYVGTVELANSEVAEDITYYFAASEQTPSSVGLGVLMNKDNTTRCAGGFIIQLMPDATEETIKKLEENLTGIDSVTNMLDAGMTPEQMLEKLLDGLGVEFNETVPCRYKCDCNRDKIERALLSLGKDQLTEIAESEEKINVHCDFCRKDYEFTSDELKALMERGKA